MDNYQKAAAANRYKTISKKTVEHLSTFEDYCKENNAYPANSPSKAFYEDSLVFLKNSMEKWVEFQFLERTFRMEIEYVADYSMAIINTFEVLPGAKDRSEKQYERIEGLHVVVLPDGSLHRHPGVSTIKATNQNGQTTQVSLATKKMTDLKENYIDLLWEVCFEPLFKSQS